MQQTVRDFLTHLAAKPGYSPHTFAAYENDLGQFLSFVLQYHQSWPEVHEETAFRYTQRDGVSMFYWIDGPFGYALAGELDRERLLEVARLVYR